MEKDGVEICAIDDKRQITAVFGCTMNGHFLPMQLIYKGTTSRCHPLKIGSPNHWSNEKTMEEYITNILLPYIRSKREELKLSRSIGDIWKDNAQPAYSNC